MAKREKLARIAVKPSERNNIPYWLPAWYRADCSERIIGKASNPAGFIRVVSGFCKAYYGRPLAQMSKRFRQAVMEASLLKPIGESENVDRSKES